MDVDWFGIERRVIAVAKATYLLISILGFRLSWLWLFSLLLRRLLSFCAIGIYVSLYLDLLLLLLWDSSRLDTVLYKCTFYLFDLSRPQLSELSSNFFAHNFVQFNNTLCCNDSNILQRMLDSLNAELQDLFVHLRVNNKVLILKNSNQCLILPYDLLVRVNWLFSVLLNFLGRLRQALQTYPRTKRRMQAHTNNSIFRTLSYFLQIVAKLLNQSEEDNFGVCLQVSLLVLIGLDIGKTVARVDQELDWLLRNSDYFVADCLLYNCDASHKYIWRVFGSALHYLIFNLLNAFLS